MQSILSRIYDVIDSGVVDASPYRDALSCIRTIGEDNGCVQVDLTHFLQEKIRKAMFREGYPLFHRELMEIRKMGLIYTAPDCFDDFMLACEINRIPESQFWLPRRRVLLPTARTLERLERDELDEVFISMPPRKGKTALVKMFMAWVILRNSERSNLYCTYSDTVAKTFYEGLLEIFDDTATYSWKDAFPGEAIAHTDAKDLRIDFDRRKAYSSFTGRSLYGSLNGTCDASGYQIMDDPHSGIEEAMNRDRLDTAWRHVENDFMTRQSVDRIKRLWIGTRWSLYDVLARRLDSLANDPEFKDVRWTEIKLPALNDKDESNFEYDFGKGNSTQSFRQKRSSYERNNDIASWNAVFQQSPIERQGAVFNPQDMVFYNGVLPDVLPDRVFMGVDPAWGGGDFVAAPVCYQYGGDIYVQDVVYTSEDKRISQPAIISMVKKHNVQAITFEATRMTASFAEDIDRALREEGVRINIMTRPAPTNTGKEQRIFDKAADIREHMHFLEEGHRPKEYNQFMQNVYSFTMNGKNKHDDAPDSLCIAVNMAFFGSSTRAEIMKSPFVK